MNENTIRFILFYFNFTIFITHFKGKPYRLCILQFIDPEQVVSVGMGLHKNVKNTSSYVSTKNSVLTQFASEAKGYCNYFV